jgi:hypothetical protein
MLWQCAVAEIGRSSVACTKPFLGVWPTYTLWQFSSEEKNVPLAIFAGNPTWTSTFLMD